MKKKHFQVAKFLGVPFNRVLVESKRVSSMPILGRQAPLHCTQVERLITIPGRLQLWGKDHPVHPIADCNGTCCQAHQKACQMPTDEVGIFSIFFCILSPAHLILFATMSVNHSMQALVGWQHHIPSSQVEVGFPINSINHLDQGPQKNLLIISLRDEDIRIMGQRGEFRGEYRLGVTKGELD